MFSGWPCPGLSVRCPLMPEPGTRVPELRGQHPRGVALEPLGHMRRAVRWPRPHERVHVVGHHLQRDEGPATHGSPLPEEVLQPPGHLAHQHRATEPRAPHHVIPQVVDTTRAGGDVPSDRHTRSVPPTINHRQSQRTRHCPRFPRAHELMDSGWTVTGNPRGGESGPSPNRGSPGSPPTAEAVDTMATSRLTPGRRLGTQGPAEPSVQVLKVPASTPLFNSVPLDGAAPRLERRRLARRLSRRRVLAAPWLAAPAPAPAMCATSWTLRLLPDGGCR